MYIPDAADLDTNDYAQLAIGHVDEVAARLRTTRDHIQALIARDDVARETILAAQDEFQALLQARVVLLSVDAVDTLQEVMQGNYGDAKGAGARVRAAESILDRGLLPKQSRPDRGEKPLARRETLPELGDLLKRAETDDRAHQIVDQYMAIMRGIDAMQRGAKEIVDADYVDARNQEIAA